jgi:hypothetical protein
MEEGLGEGVEHVLGIIETPRRFTTGKPIAIIVLTERRFQGYP